MKKIIILSFYALAFFASKAQTSNFGFETWHNYFTLSGQLTAPNGWSGLDSLICSVGPILNTGGTFVKQVEKETPGYGGSAAALRVVTKNQDSLTGFFGAGPFPGLCTNAQIGVDQTTGFSLSGGLAYTGTPVTATMWIKNLPVGGDSTQITIMAIDNSDGGDSIAYIADTLIGATITNFTQITIPFIEGTPGFNTTLLRVMITSSGNANIDTTGTFTGLHAGTSITVDDIAITAPTGVTQYIYSSKVASVYPTQMNDVLNLNLQPNDISKYEFKIYSLNGETVYSTQINKSINQLPISQLAKGNYIYTISKDSKTVQSGKLTKE